MRARVALSAAALAAAALTARPALAAKYALAMFHFNVQYVAGGTFEAKPLDGFGGR